MSVKRVRSLPLFPSVEGSYTQEEAAWIRRPSERPDMEVDGTSSRPNTNKRSYVRPPVCTYYMEGRCNRNPCNFLHPDDPSAVASHTGSYNGKRSNFTPDDSSFQGGSTRRNVWGRLRGSKAGKVSAFGEARHGKSRDKPCHFFLRGNCNKGDQCNYLHSYTNSNDISFMTQLSGHEKAVRAIALPAGANKLYTGGQDGTIRVWDCDTGQSGIRALLISLLREIRSPNFSAAPMASGEDAGVQMDAAKLETVRDLLDLKNVHEVRSFLGLCSYYRRYVQKFAEIASSLHLLTQKGVPFSWGATEATAFQILKDKMTTGLVLILPDLQKSFEVYLVLDLLKSYISDQKTQWERYLPLVEFAYNNLIHSSTGKAPFEIVEGAMKVPLFLSTKDKIFEADEYTRDLDTAFAKVRETLQKSQERQKKAADRHRRDLKLKEND
ncbi:hypothetical protein L7F22_005695 [Adiantum nelumboides]|nr:hypothetical protein [Adiantum nelumboides]